MTKKIVALVGAWALCLSGCSSDETQPPYVPDASVPIKTAEQLLGWDEDMEKRLSAASASLDQARAAISTGSVKDRAPILAAIEGGQAAVRDVVARQKQASLEFGIAFAAMDEVRKEKLKLEAENKNLEVRQKDLENRERLWSMGFFTALGVMVVTLAALLPKFTTMFLDRKYRKLEIAEKEHQILALSSKAASQIP